ncbi:flavin prenyltransferase UbiX [Candidatus Halobeggiatoa sp. HSG11]|nr:flavin prenyltransferase UbiX [Candidatus Halobeggiatoa sp. HSG11]
MNKAITLAMTGASGAAYGLRLLEQLIIAKRQVYFLISEPARLVLDLELKIKLPSHPEAIQDFLTKLYQAVPNQLQVLSHNQWTAPIASGSSVPEAMVVCPCTSSTLAGIANGLSQNLLERAADVILKERQKLILVHRETPLSEIHLENMLRLTKMGVIILPANPGFYHHPQTIDDIVDFIVARICDHLAVEHSLSERWGDVGERENIILAQ